MGKTMRAIGLMSGTSMDGIDVALLETDGEESLRRGPNATFPYSAEVRAQLRAAIREAKALERRDARPGTLADVERHLTELFARGIAPLQYLFVTHQETPHCGGLGRILARFPETILCGDVSDYHLAFPQYEHRMRSMNEGDAIDLGGRSLMAVEPVIRDLRTTWWGFDTRERVLFPGDGFAYSHYHLDGHCGLLAEEAVSLDLPDVSAVFADLALFWTKFADMDAYCERLDQLIERLGVKTIAPTHGLPIADVRATVPKVQEGLKAAALMPESGTNEKAPVTGAAAAMPAA